jgi:hypothetical protein
MSTNNEEIIMINLLLTIKARNMLKKRLYSDKDAFMKIFEYKYSFATVNRIINDSSYCCSKRCMKLIKELFPTVANNELFVPFNEYEKDIFSKIEKGSLGN